MRTRWMLLCGTLLAILLTPASSVAVPTAAGLTVTIDVPDTYAAGEPFIVSGHLTAAFGLPIILEVGRGVPDEEIVVRADGVVVARALTGADGSYQAELVFDGLAPTTRSLQAIAFEGQLIETRSRVVETRLDRVLVDLVVTPSDLQLAVGDQAQLTATAMWDDGRTADVTADVSWATSDAEVATVTSSGTVHATGSGNATVSATLHGKTAGTALTVP